MERMLTIREVAFHLNVSYQMALGFVHKGQIAAVRYGGQWRIAMKELERFQQEGNHPEAAALAELQGLKKKEEDDDNCN